LTQKTFPVGEFTAEEYPEAHKFEVKFPKSEGMPVSPKGNEYGRMHVSRQEPINPHTGSTKGKKSCPHFSPIGTQGTQVLFPIQLQYDPTGQSMSSLQGDPILCKDTHTESEQVPL